MPAQAFICGCAGLELSAQDRAFIREADPWGLILFKRNIDSPVLVDQEGGRVQRLGPPHWRKYPAGAAFARMSNDPLTQRGLARLAGRLMAHDLLQLGITVDCLPVLDVPAAGSHSVIGDRAYGMDVTAVAALGRAAAEGLMAGGVLPVMKHVPGHGRANADSHMELPVVRAPREALEAGDFMPFRILADLPMAMTAHVVYTALDPNNPATTSRKVMREIVRGHIGYDGLVMTDDLSMKALSGTFAQKTRAAFRAGADMALHCNGDIGESRQVAAEAPVLRGKRLRRAEAALARARHMPEPLDNIEAALRLDLAMRALA
jgi:beta-N-acetylhexosaminidase